MSKQKHLGVALMAGTMLVGASAFAESRPADETNRREGGRIERRAAGERGREAQSQVEVRGERRREERREGDRERVEDRRERAEDRRERVEDRRERVEDRRELAEDGRERVEDLRERAEERREGNRERVEDRRERAEERREGNRERVEDRRERAEDRRERIEDQRERIEDQRERIDDRRERADDNWRGRSRETTREIYRDRQRETSASRRGETRSEHRGIYNRGRYHGGSYGRYDRSRPYYYSGRVSKYERYRDGYRVWLFGAAYPFFVPSHHWHHSRFRVGIDIRLGGYYNPAGYYDYYDYGRVGRLYQSGELHGYVESLNYRRRTAVVQDSVTGEFITVFLTSRDRLFDDLRPGDYVELRGAWTRGHFEAHRVLDLETR